MSQPKSPITTHVLDVAIGRPARGVALTLSRLTGEDFEELARGETDADGRHTHLLSPGSLVPGTYRIRFDVGPYLAGSAGAGSAGAGSAGAGSAGAGSAGAQPQRDSFYPYVEIVFTVAATDEHYHVPLLLSPYGYSTYRGS